VRREPEATVPPLVARRLRPASFLGASSPRALAFELQPKSAAGAGSPKAGPPDAKKPGGSMLSIRVGLADKTKEKLYPLDELTRVASALTLQLQRDVQPIWHVNASVSALADPASIPPGVWPVFILDKLPPGEGGVHLTAHHQPYAKIVKGNTWTLDASHEIIEMVVDPQASRLQAANAIRVGGPTGFEDAPGKFEYLVEACDPCEDQNFSYLVDDVMVSDFLTPHFYDPVVSSGVRYSFTGAIQQPRQVLQGGYLSWLDPKEGVVQQARFFGKPEIVTLGPASGALRVISDSKSCELRNLSRTDEGHPKRRAQLARREALVAQAADRAKAY
jgi:hypothetical protein